MDDNSPYLPGLSPVGSKQLQVAFDGGLVSSDGGVVLLREVERTLGLAERLAACLCDARDPSRIEHPIAAMMRYRMFAIAAGYPDCDDCDGLRVDPAFKIALDRDPVSGAALCSQPTLSRLENAPSRIALVRMSAALIDGFCDS